MPLALYEDANRKLDEVKLKFTGDDDAYDESKDADIVVRATLFDTFGDLVNTWDSDDENVPELIVEISAMLMASYRIAKIYSMETSTESTYASRLEKKAMMLLSQLANGSMTFADYPDAVSGTAFSQDDFWPNATTVDPCDTSQPLRAFSMDMRF